MKHTSKHKKSLSTGPQPVPIRFEFTNSTAVSVCVAGTFNDWQPEAKPLHPTGDGHWLKETVLFPGTYEYRLVVDGQWMADPLARESVPNPFGGSNSILRVAESLEATHLANAENEPLTINN